jgi:hypothetical protein
VVVAARGAAGDAARTVGGSGVGAAGSPFAIPVTEGTAAAGGKGVDAAGGPVTGVPAWGAAPVTGDPNDAAPAAVPEGARAVANGPDRLRGEDPVGAVAGGAPGVALAAAWAAASSRTALEYPTRATSRSWVRVATTAVQWASEAATAAATPACSSAGDSGMLATPTGPAIRRRAARGWAGRLSVATLGVR